MDFSVVEFLAWCRTKPASEAYCYSSFGHCALAQFLRETGLSANPRVGAYHYELVPGKHVFFNKTTPGLVDALALAPQTFGALVKRLGAIVQETPVVQSPWTDPQTYLDVDCGEHVL